MQGAGKEDTPGESQHISEDPSESLGAAFPVPGSGARLCASTVSARRGPGRSREGWKSPPSSEL